VNEERVSGWIRNSQLARIMQIKDKQIGGVRMARKRFITSDMSIDEKIADIAAENPVAALMWPWFITGFDDWGRMEAMPKKIKLSIFQAFPYTAKDIEGAINLYDKYGIVYKYEVDGKSYLAIEPEKFYKYQTYIRGNKREIDSSNCPPPPNPPWDIVKSSTETEKENYKHADARTCAHISADERNCIPSPSPSPSPSKERDINARARDNIFQISSQEKKFDVTLQKINDKAFEFGMNGITPEFIEDAEMRLSEGTDPELIIKALAIGATNANGNAGAKCRYAISVLQGWASEGIRTLEQWNEKYAPKSRDKPKVHGMTAAKLDKYERAKQEAFKKLEEMGVVFDDEEPSRNTS